MLMKQIYLDNSATTKVDKGVVSEMQKYMADEYGNASSAHSMGEKARKAIDDARKKIAKELNARAEEIIFTSGATESDNIALMGIAKASNRKKIIISSIEHPAVYECAMHLREEGYKIVEIPVNGEGLLMLGTLENEIDNNTLLVSIIHGHNEFGTVQDIEKIGKICLKKGVLFHTDAAQTFGKIKIDVQKMNISLLSASAHKIGGPKGIGFLYVKNGAKIKPLIYGGGQEKGLRSGTENVPGIVGFAAALKNTINKNKIEKLRNYFIKGLENIGGKLNGSRGERLYNNINMSFDVDADNLVVRLSEKGIMCSTGSACNEKNDNKRTLKALGLTENKINGAVRFVLSEETTKKDVYYVVKEISGALNILRV